MRDIKSWEQLSAKLKWHVEDLKHLSTEQHLQETIWCTTAPYVPRSVHSSKHSRAYMIMCSCTHRHFLDVQTQIQPSSLELNYQHQLTRFHHNKRKKQDTDTFSSSTPLSTVKECKVAWTCGTHIKQRWMAESAMWQWGSREQDDNAVSIFSSPLSFLQMLHDRHPLPLIEMPFHY